MSSDFAEGRPPTDLELEIPEELRVACEQVGLSVPRRSYISENGPRFFLETTFGGIEIADISKVERSRRAKKLAPNAAWKLRGDPNRESDESLRAHEGHDGLVTEPRGVAKRGELAVKLAAMLACMAARAE